LKAYYQPITPEDKKEKPLPILVNNQPEWEIEHILAKRKSRNKMQYLVKRKGFELHDATWESAANLKGTIGLFNWKSRNE
jgi:hypothetical protein